MSQENTAPVADLAARIKANGKKKAARKPAAKKVVAGVPAETAPVKQRRVQTRRKASGTVNFSKHPHLNSMTEGQAALLNAFVGSLS